MHRKFIFYDNSSGVLSVAMNFWLYAYAGNTHGTWGLNKIGDTAPGGFEQLEKLASTAAV